MMEKTTQELMLENAALYYTDASAWKAALGIFTTLAQLNPNNHNAWFGIGSTLWRLGVEQPELLDMALGPLKRAVELNPNPDNRTYKHLLRTAEDSARKSGVNPDTIPAYQGDPAMFAETITFTPEMLVEPAQKMNWEARAKLVMAAGETRGELFLPLLEALASSDPNMQVKRAAGQALANRPSPVVSTTEMQAASSRLSTETAPTDDDDETDAAATDDAGGEAAQG
jgi:tetratricopeptide (TPR) repeat protein